LLKTAGRWPWRSESAQECVTTHLPKQLALKMGGAIASCLYRTVGRQSENPEQGRRAPSPAEAPTSRGVATVSVEGLWARACPEPPSVQILVVVANTPEGSWRTDAEKGFM
jgi:hypothetical protein